MEVMVVLAICGATGGGGNVGAADVPDGGAAAHAADFVSIYRPNLEVSAYNTMCTQCVG